MTDEERAAEASLAYRHRLPKDLDPHEALAMSVAYYDGYLTAWRDAR